MIFWRAFLPTFKESNILVAARSLEKNGFNQQHCKRSSQESMQENRKFGDFNGKPAYNKCFTQPEPYCAFLKYFFGVPHLATCIFLIFL